MDVQSLKNHLEKHGQKHLLQFWDSLDSSQQQQLVEDLERINIPEVIRYFNATTSHKPSQNLDTRMEPIPAEQYSSSALSNKEQLKNYKEIGLKGIREGKVASLLLAGGQGKEMLFR
jgi:UDP-N-acetylglucosamine/UDP-N-acetylgalactosamine diphosphorylase